MDERPSTATGLDTADGSREIYHRECLLRAAAFLGEAQGALLHRQTHETHQASLLIDKAVDEIAKVWRETEETGEGEQGSEGVHGEDTQEAEVARVS